jgi:hypothetical protein
MESQFLCQCHGHMKAEITEDVLSRFQQLREFSGRTISVIRMINRRKNIDGYWENKDLVQQTKQEIIVFEILHPAALLFLSSIIRQTIMRSLPMR